VLHIGDLDDHGQAIYHAAEEDVIAWAEHGDGKAEFMRLAVTPEQVTALDLPDDPTRPGWVQAEAIAPDVMTALLRDAVTARLASDVFDGMLANEKEQRSRLLATFDTDEADD
jgi:hypothetical protein